MKTNFSTFLALLLAFTVSCSTAGTHSSDKDIAEIMKLALERAVVAGELPDYHLMKDKQNIAISSENINTALLPQLSGITLDVLTERQIQEKADTDERFLYLKFRSIQVKGNQAEVILDNIHAVGKSTKVMGYGGSFTIAYQKVKGNWEGKVTSYTVP